MKIIWQGHSCFMVESRGGTIVFDPYENGSVPGYSPLALTADEVFCSHLHRDHGAEELVLRTGKQVFCQIERIHTFHDEEGGTQRGENIIHLLSAEGLRIAHFGDLGCSLTSEQIKNLRGLDVIMIPVGGFYTIGPEQAKAIVDQIEPTVVIPMHFREGRLGYEVLGGREEFLKRCDNVVRCEGNSLLIKAGMPRQTVALTYQD